MGRILVNDRCLLTQRTGIGQYLASIIAHWPTDATMKLVGVHYRGFQRKQASITPTANALPALSTLAPASLRPLSSVTPPKTLWLRTLLKNLRPSLGKLHAYLIRREFYRKEYVSFLEPNNIPEARIDPTVTTMMDLSVLELPHMHPADRVAHWRRQLEAALKWTRHWICISQATADAMRRVLGVAPEHMTVVHLASRWGQAPGDWTPAAARQQLGLPERYLLCLGTIEPRKNIHRLLDAYAMQPAAWRRRTPLILAGMPGWGDDEYWRSLREHPVAAETFTTGYLDDAQAFAILRGASCLLYPSLYEGFGLPPLEAMSQGTPVVASSAPSVLEVCGDAAPILDPHDTDGWKHWMERATEPSAERDRWIARGKAQATLFSWSKAAREHHRVFERMARAA